MQNRFYVNESKAKLMLFAHRRDNNSLLSQLPSELMTLIMNAPMTKQEAVFAAALEDAAFGRLDELKTKLAANPQLVMERGSVITPGGFAVEDTTLLECAIGGGDPDMVAMIKPYFSKVENGEEALEKQLAAYRDSVTAMETQKPYDLTGLIELIKASTPDVVTAALNKQYDPHVKLHQALIQFREAVRSKTVTKSQMHYNYNTLIHAFEIYEDEWDNLYKASKNNYYDKCNLVWCQVIGYLQRGLPAEDRFAFAQGLFDVVKENAPLIRNVQYQYEAGTYPDFSLNSSDLSGLGFDYGIYGSARDFTLGGCDAALIAKFISNKKCKLAELMQSSRSYQLIQCVIC